MDNDIEYEGLQQPNVTVIGNTTYCWDDELESYTWCTGTDQLYTVPLSILVPLSGFYGAISLMAICGNLLVIGVVAFTRSMRTVTNLYIANLASADVIIAVFCIPFQFYAALLQRWDLPAFMCNFCPFTQTLSVNVSIFTLVTISVDRYKAIMSALSKRSSETSAKAMILGLWIFSIFLALPMPFFFEYTHVFDESNGGMKPFCTLGALLLQQRQQTEEEEVVEEEEASSFFQRISTFKTYNLALSVVQYVLPLLVISFAYLRMGVKLWLNQTPGAAQMKRDQMILSNKKKTIKMLLIVVSIFVVCWMPWHLYQVFTIIFPEINEYHYINIVFFFSHWLAMSNSCYNPFIYAIYSEKFKREFRECAYCKCCQSLFRRSSVMAGIEVHQETVNGRCSPAARAANSVKTLQQQQSVQHVIARKAFSTPAASCQKQVGGGGGENVVLINHRDDANGSCSRPINCSPPRTTMEVTHPVHDDEEATAAV